MKKSIFLFFAAILCAIGVNAADIPAGTKLYLKPNSNWSGARYAVYFYGNGDTWVSMQLVSGESNIYEVTSPNKVYKNLIFCRMDPNIATNGWDNDGNNMWNQTSDLTYDGTKNLYTVKENTWDKGGGTWSVYTPPTTETKYYVTGTGNLVGGDGWKANEVELVLSDGKYTHTFTGLTKGETYELKVTQNGNWNEGVWGAQNLNNISYYDISGNDNIVLKPSQDGDLTVSFSNNIISLSGITAPKRYITGESLVGNWNGDAQLMNYANGKHTFTKTLAAGTYAFKITDGTWNNSWGNNGGNYEFTTTEGEVTIEFDDTNKSINVILPEINYFITGNTDLVGGDGWKANEIKMTETSGIYTYEFTNLAADKLYLMKVTNGSWSESYGHDALQNTDAKVENYGGNIAFYLSAAGNVNVSFDLANKKITLTGSFAAIPAVRIHFVNTDGWEKVYAYAWDGDSKNAEYPGEDITSQTDGKVNDFNVHYIEFKLGKYANVIFGCGTDECKTGDMTVSDHVGKYYYDGTWYDSTNDIPAPADPAEVKCYLMGNGDWENGVEMTLNPENDNEFVLNCHHISAPFKFKYGEEWSDQVENYDFTGIAWVDGNIELPEGCYSFYFKKDSKKVYIAECTPTPYDVTLEGMVTSQFPRNGRGYTLLVDGEGNELQIWNESAAWAYGDYTVTGDLYGVTVEGTGTWADVDGVETLTATLQACGAIYNVTATVGTIQSFTINSFDATYTVDSEYGEVIFRGVAEEGGDFEIYVGNTPEGQYAIGMWNTTEIMATEITDFELNSLTKEYKLGGVFEDEVGNTYEVFIIALPAEQPVEIWEDDNASIIAANAGKVVDVQVNRYFAPNTLYTIALPFTLNNVSSLFGNQAYEYTSLKQNGSDVVLVFSKVNTIIAGKPYLIEPTKEVDGFAVNGVTLSNNPQTISKTVSKTTVSMEAVLSVNTDETTDGKYWLAADRYLYSNEKPLPSLRALFTITTAGGIAPRARVELNENTVTGVDDITTDEAATIKLLDNNQLIIIRGGEMYNAQGQKL